MTIKIVDEPEVQVTAYDLTRYTQEYCDAYRFYAGPIPSFEEFIRRRQAEEGKS